MLNIIGGVANVIYPPVCSGCGVITGGHRGMCAACWSSIRFIERPYCEVLGLPFSHDLGQNILCAEAIANPPPFDRLRSVAIHDGVVRNLVHALKYRDRTDLAIMMAEWILRASDGTVAASDAIIPVPLHRWRLVWRKFNQAAELARQLARISGKPLLASTLVRRKRTLQQVGLGAKARQDNVRGAFVVRDAHIGSVLGKRIVLVDDVYTTGATVSSAARALKKAGAVDVTVLTFARAVSAPI
ncbi:ComF family protein [Rhizobiaceae bacterium n13]|uniref:ComF family protein n=1 Tax=Ferirhizobium litorale TaxID=2927786 RepID=A0AAE3QEZ7_9HYPH|nr:ComF family protein [Fererhizobium litorale]MDI7864258.1 ComF family protein [Fererhizobium litorale]MDI7924637.1 ComF family protein [Fererhizobium litorale]